MINHMCCIKLNEIEKRERGREREGVCGGPLPVIRITFVFSVQLRTYGSFSPKTGSKM